jgi:hypothetical protein
VGLLPEAVAARLVHAGTQAQALAERASTICDLVVPRRLAPLKGI